MGNEAEKMNQDSTQQIKSAVTSIDSQAILSRVKEIITSPTAAIEKIKNERTSSLSLLAGYLLPLMAASFLCMWLGGYFVGLMNFFGGFINAIVQTAVALVATYFLAVAINKFLPKLQCQASVDDATKLLCISLTPGCVGGILGIIPPLMLLGIIPAIYGLYLLYTGIPKLLNVPAEKQLPVFGSIIGGAIVINFILFVTAGFLLTNVLRIEPYKTIKVPDVADVLEQIKQITTPR